MSFSNEVKKEICENSEVKPCCMHALAYGMALFTKKFLSSEILFSTDHDFIGDLFCSLIFKTSGERPTYIQTRGTKKQYIIKGDSAKRVFECFNHDIGEVTHRINRANLNDECCFAAFLRGAFLACGTISNPARNYHLEFIVQYMKLSQDLLKVIQDMDLNPKYLIRKNSYVIYFKDSESIEDMFMAIGAQKSALEIMGMKIYKDVCNNINRKVNSETANISRVVEASTIQVQAIKKLQGCGKFNSLPNELKDLAVLRLDNPELSLRELGEMLSPPLTRSGVNHRINKILDMADKC